MKTKITRTTRLFLLFFILLVVFCPFKNTAQGSNSLFDIFGANPSFNAFNLQPVVFPTIQITKPSINIPLQTPAPQNQTTPAPQPKAQPLSSNPFSGAKLYVDPNCNAAKWVAYNSKSNPSSCSVMSKIASQPVAQWFGSWNQNIKNDVSATTQNAVNSGALPIFVAYNIPHLDCGGRGAVNASAYRTWIQNFADGIGANKAVVILEPDALAGMSCLSMTDQNERMGLIKYAVSVLNAEGKISVYIDAGNPGWTSVNEMAGRLNNSGILQAQGFSLNVSNFFTTAQNIQYGTQLSQLVNGKHFVIDTSRNGNGPAASNQWCNPSGRALGTLPTSNTGNNLVDAYLWIKNPTESDGSCNGGPTAGTFYPTYAISLGLSAGI